YAPDQADEVLADRDDEYNVHRIRIGDVVVRYVEDIDSIQVTIEGQLPEALIRQLKADLVEKLSLLERSAVCCRDVLPL
ncbi:MAG: hypothetical protein AAFX85_18545, partial [Pseudomonadota bacterium]